MHVKKKSSDFNYKRSISVEMGVALLWIENLLNFLYNNIKY